MKGRVWKFGDNISTDLLQPSQFSYLTQPDMTDEQSSRYVMYANRPGWASLVKPGDIVVGGRNFGCGSSRRAAGPVKALGISCIVAESIARIFFRNSISLGLPVLAAPGIHDFCEELDMLQVDFDTGQITNLTGEKTMRTNPIPKDSPPAQVLSAGGIIRLLAKELEK